jgi:hypothetical protein
LRRQFAKKKRSQHNFTHCRHGRNDRSWRCAGSAVAKLIEVVPQPVWSLGLAFQNVVAVARFQKSKEKIASITGLAYFGRPSIK